MEPQVQIPPQGTSQVTTQTSSAEAGINPAITGKKNNSLTTILIAVAVILIGLGIGAYFVFTNKEGSVYKAIFGEPEESESDTDEGDEADLDGDEEDDEEDGEDEDDEGDDVEDPYADWETYTETTCDVTIKYPDDWEVDDSENVEMGLITISNDNYQWKLYREPIVTGGGFGYQIELVEPSTVDEVTVSPDIYNSTMVTNYVSRADLVTYYGASIVSDYNIQADTWEGSALFTDPDAHILGFGPGEMYSDENCDWFGIWYQYDYEMADRSDLPVRGNVTLVEMLDTMNLTTNSVEL